MYWVHFNIYALISVVCWLVGISLIYIFTQKYIHSIANSIIVAGILSLALFTAFLWLPLQRPPMRTLGETRLWYALFIAITGFVAYCRWKYKWFLLYSLSMSILFVLINLFKPEAHDKTLMPALQSLWFIPHVIVYMLAYALLAAPMLISLKGLWDLRRNTFDPVTLNKADNMVYMGFSLLSLGLIFGALWAKEAWGHYWTWDPKETWAFITWMVYMLYIHYRYHRSTDSKTALNLLVLAFIFLLICWIGDKLSPLGTKQYSCV